MHSGFTWIGLYFVFNMGLTLYNKTVLVHFPFPYSLTALHTLCGTIGCLWLRNTGYFTPARLTVRQNLTLAAFSVLYTLNIAVSNLSLQLVTVPFHQVVRASAPFFTILVSMVVLFLENFVCLTLLSLVPVIAGVGFATYGDYSFTAWGFILTLFGTFLAALKTTVVSTSIKLNPLDLLMRMSPLAFVQCVFYAWLSGELERAAVHKGPGLEGWSRKSATVLLLNGIIAFLLNIVSLTANQKNGPLTMTVAANVKQVLTILLAMYMFHLTITPANTIGIALTLAGGAWYGALEYEEKKNRLRMV
ncbi:hypothetical protein M407DRAFT_81495 [Tulasnella calospora MUT 4182]|uniref:Sugar phosphate transporter domain-containing protein n=2 Tax=Tulasnella calospora MUT 4182 TaxID=1051891 RepID=A0A0C3PYQ8_9AGAM|nr:hypothetical protein M407DRAFT_81495 [Tulasnella calospora MUT 4182]